MNEFERLIAYLKIAYHNLTTLHRHLVRDAGWFGNHEQLGEWYDSLAGQLDDLTEIGLALGYAEPSIKDAVLQFGADVLAAEPRELRDTLTRAMEIMRSASGMMTEAKKLVPPDVSNRLEEYVYHWNKEANYKIAHALGAGVSSPKTIVDDDDD